MANNMANLTSSESPLTAMDFVISPFVDSLLMSIGRESTNATTETVAIQAESAPPHDNTDNNHSSTTLSSSAPCFFPSSVNRRHMHVPPYYPGPPPPPPLLLPHSRRRPRRLMGHHPPQNHHGLSQPPPYHFRQTSVPKSHSITWPFDMTNSAMRKHVNRITLYKTRLCKYHLCEEPRCANSSEECAYAHSEAELRPRPDLRKTGLCRRFLQGSCPQQHDSTACKFAHGLDDLQPDPRFPHVPISMWQHQFQNLLRVQRVGDTMIVPCHRCTHHNVVPYVN